MQCIEICRMNRCDKMMIYVWSPHRVVQLCFLVMETFFQNGRFPVLFFFLSSWWKIKNCAEVRTWLNLNRYENFNIFLMFVVTKMNIKI